MTQIIWTFLIIISIVILFAVGFLLYGSFTEFKPASEVALQLNGGNKNPLDTQTEFSFITWNLGYAGLGKEMDFFYDGGKGVRPSREDFDRYLEKIGWFIRQHDTVDFILLQEIDTCSKRSYHINEVTWMASLLPEYCFSFGINYNSRFIPVPFFNPMGRVTSGVATFSVFRPLTATRVGFDNTISWPKRLYYFKRCFVVTHFGLPGDKEFLVVNVHNSAFDTGGILRQREMENLSSYLRNEHEKGNFIVAGGDWNANPPGFEPGHITTGDRIKTDEFTSLDIFFPGWKFVADPFLPTNRNVDKPYEIGVTPTTILDFFLVSPNVEILAVSTFPTLFEESDHQPVYLKVSLNPIP
ncbi:MAG: endonuclease/exonuclease/phosphatase family protein [bacterium]